MKDRFVVKEMFCISRRLYCVPHLFVFHKSEAVMSALILLSLHKPIVAEQIFMKVQIDILKSK
jgi:hypothetical protein